MFVSNINQLIADSHTVVTHLTQATHSATQFHYGQKLSEAIEAVEEAPRHLDSVVSHLDCTLHTAEQLPGVPHPTPADDQLSTEDKLLLMFNNQYDLEGGELIYEDYEPVGVRHDKCGEVSKLDLLFNHVTYGLTQLPNNPPPLPGQSQDQGD